VIYVTFLGAYRYIPEIIFVPNLRDEEGKAMAESGNYQTSHPTTILVATNLSDLSRLMPFALSMAGESGAQLLLLHVLTVTGEFTANTSGMAYYDREGAFSCASSIIEPWCAQARKLGIPCTALLREGSPIPREIIAAVRRYCPDRLLLGTRSLGRLGNLFLGSVAEQVLRSVNLPVFTVGPEAHLTARESGRQPAVLFATSLGEGHRDHAALACRLAAGQNAKLILLHVLPKIGKEIRHAASNILDSTISYELKQLAGKIADNACSEVDISVAHGDPAIEILALADAIHASLIVMGVTEHTLFDSLTHDRTIRRVLAHAQCPVLSLHRAAAQQLQSQTEAVVIHGSHPRPAT
jgi:nucleotide-binding universal stress UspA family protein